MKPEPHHPHGKPTSREPTGTADTCERCGRYGAIQMGDHRLCPDCLDVAGSCCPEFGAWDAWCPESTGSSPDHDASDQPS